MNIITLLPCRWVLASELGSSQLSDLTNAIWPSLLVSCCRKFLSSSLRSGFCSLSLTTISQFSFQLQSPIFTQSPLHRVTSHRSLFSWLCSVAPQRKEQSPPSLCKEILTKWSQTHKVSIDYLSTDTTDSSSFSNSVFFPLILMGKLYIWLI